MSDRCRWIIAGLLGLVLCPGLASQAPIHDCDRLAANPDDEEKVVDGIDWDLLDPDQAIPACEAAIRDNPGVLRFQFQLARASLKAETHNVGIPILIRLSDMGYVRATYALGLTYFEGEGVSRDYAKALRLYLVAARQGDRWAQNNLGYMYDEGYGVPEDDTEAVKWYRRAAEQGHARAQTNLGYMYDEGHGVSEDDVEAVKWYREAAEQGFAVAQNNLGFMYDDGRGIPEDDVEAVKWYRKAAVQGHARAQNNLGAMYDDGHGSRRTMSRR